MSWWKRVNLALKKEPETWLAYIYGQQFQNLKHLQEAKPRFEGGFLRFLIWGYTLLRQTRLVFSPKSPQCKYLVFAGTRNQKSALDATVDALRDEGQEVLAIAPALWLRPEDHAKSRYQAIQNGPQEMLKSLALLPVRFFYVYRQLQGIDKALVRKYLDAFLNSHRSLIYFDRILATVAPKYVIVSNDHNADNRALLAIARQRGIRTVYMQHASVSDLFPALNVDYAFLDGQVALEIYRQCEHNHPPEDPPNAERTVFLTGQKKTVRSSQQHHGKAVGLALNSLDKTEDVQDLLQHLTRYKFPVKVRWHPGMGERAIKALIEATKMYPIQYSDPRKESISAFLASTHCLIAGSSSIHLEAALCGVVPIYYEITPAEVPDYYGYVKHGLAMPARDIIDLNQQLTDIIEDRIRLDPQSVQYYSATFDTEWLGKEGELVAKTLMALDSKKPLPVEPMTL